MPMNCITKDQQLAVEAKLNMLLGATEYDRLFMEFQLTDFQWGILSVRVKSEHIDEIQNRYWLHIAIVAESVLRRAVRVLNFLSKDYSGSTAH
jgi:hypothetical protein